MFERIKHAIQTAEYDLRADFPPGHVRLPESPPVKAAARVAKPVLDLADYHDGITRPPPAVHRTHLGSPALHDVLGNDQWGDCGEAMALHGFEAYHLDAKTPVPPFQTTDALRLYSVVGGFDPNQGPPGQNPTDQGTDNQVLVDHLRDHGVRCQADGSVHKIAGSLFVDPANVTLTKLAIWEFVVLYRAVGLPITAQGQNYWKLIDPSLQGDAAVGSWGYHDIPYFSYDGQRLRNDSWGQQMLVDWDFDVSYAVQGIVFVTQEMLDLRGVSPAGFNWTKLNADLANFPAAPANG